jgi:hypothetical protein
VPIVQIFLVEHFRQIDKDGFRPFMLLARGGATFEVLEEVLDTLQEHGAFEAMAIALIFASKVLKSPRDIQRLERKQSMVDKLIAETWIYQKMLREANEGKREEILAEGELKGIRLAIVVFMEKRAPSLRAWVEAKLEHINDMQVLQQIMDALFVAKSVKEIKAAFPV